MAQWLRGELRETLRDALSPARVRAQGIFRSGRVQRIMDDHQARRADHSRPLWSLLMFSLWYDRYYRRRP
jgi:asparagine synthase (glutamine-hydrolysing)